MHLRLSGNKLKDLSPYCQSCYFNGAFIPWLTIPKQQLYCKIVKLEI